MVPGMTRTPLLVGIGLLLSGCAGSGAGLDANGQPLTSGSGGAGPLTADFASIQSHVFTPICSVCHVGGGAPQGLRLDATNSYSLLVGVPSTEVPSVLRVKPGDPNNSYLIQKLEGHAAVGARMPFGGPYLSADVISTIAQWITNGAPATAAAAVPAAASVARADFRVVAMVPAAGDHLDQPPSQIVVSFNQEIDVNRVDAQSLRVQRVASGANDGARPDLLAPDRARVNDVPIALGVIATNPRVLLVTPREPMVQGHYRVVIRQGLGVGLSDIMGQPLEHVAATEGGDELVGEFDVEAAP